MTIHNLTKFHQNWMLSSPLIVFTDKVTDTHTNCNENITPPLFRGGVNMEVYWGGMEPTLTSL